MFYYVYRDGSVFERRWADDSPDLKEISHAEYEEIKSLHEQNSANLAQFAGKHQGQDIHIFGCGPSLNEFAARQDWSGKITIGTNYSITSIPNPTYWVMVDNYFQNTPAMKAIQEWAKEARTTRFVSKSMLFERYRPGNETFLLNHAREPGCSDITKGVYWRSSVIQAAIDLARFMQANRIILWGIDYHDKTHNYTGQISDPNDGKGSWDMFKLKDQFKALQDQCFRYELYADPNNPNKLLRKAIRIPILNANLNSALEVFPKVSPAEILGLQEAVDEVRAEGEPLAVERSSEDMSPQEFSRSIEFDLDNRNLVIRHSGNGMMVFPFDGLAQFPELVFLKQYVKRMDALGVWSGEEPKAKKAKKTKKAEQKAEPKAKPKPEPKPAKPKTDEPKTDEPKSDEPGLLDFISNIPQSDMGITDDLITEDELLNG